MNTAEKPLSYWPPQQILVGYYFNMALVPGKGVVACAENWLHYKFVDINLYRLSWKMFRQLVTLLYEDVPRVVCLVVALT